MRWQRRLKSYSSEDQTLFLKPCRGTVDILCEHLSLGDEPACHSKPKSICQAEGNPVIASATIWRTTELPGSPNTLAWVRPGVISFFSLIRRNFWRNAKVRHNHLVTRSGRTG